MNLLAYCDGNHDLLAIADIIGAPLWELTELIDPLVENGLLRNYGSDKAQNV